MNMSVGGCLPAEAWILHGSRWPVTASHPRVQEQLAACLYVSLSPNTSAWPLLHPVCTLHPPVCVPATLGHSAECSCPAPAMKLRVPAGVGMGVALMPYHCSVTAKTWHKQLQCPKLQEHTAPLQAQGMSNQLQCPTAA